MGVQLIEAAEQLESERNIPKQVFINAICDSILAAYKKKVPDHNIDGVHIQFDEVTGEIGIFAPKTIVETVTNECREIAIAEAKELLPDVVLDEILEIDVTPDDFAEYGRIAAQAAKQIMTQRLREAEKDLVKQEFVGRQGTMMTGQIKRIEILNNGKPNVVVDLGRFEGHIPPREQLPGETYKVGSRIRVYVKELRESGRVPTVIVSHTHEELVKELFELEVPEIDDGTVEIKAIAREAGYRTKIAVHSNDADIDPVGACIGSRGARIQNVVTELRNEKIDVIRWSQDPIDFISNSLSPARIVTVALYDDPTGRRAEVIVPDDQLSLAIGKNGQNVRLAAKLTEWKIDIRSETQIQGQPFGVGAKTTVVLDQKDKDKKEVTEEVITQEPKETKDQEPESQKSN
ncbi:MAG: transcription termination/antitermination protein NusA [Candidatus Melainabacteria bacterium]|nr:transcription termination/antitermination protein NusA [Candidatus Melainabacteria bacterium]